MVCERLSSCSCLAPLSLNCLGQDDTWTLRDGAQTVMQHEYMEFRYAQISGDIPEPPTPETARAWVVRYPLSDKASDQYGDEPMLAVSKLRPEAEMATFKSANASLDAVWNLVKYTLVAVSLDVKSGSFLDLFVAHLANLESITYCR